MPRIIGDPDELTTSINHAARSQAREIEREAKEKADRIKKEAETEAGRVREEILDDAGRQEKEILLQHRVRVSREKTGEYLHERESILDDIWASAEERLRSLTEDENAYAEALRRLVLAAAPAAGPGEALVTSHEKGYRLLTEERLESWSDEASERIGDKITFTRADSPLEESSGGLLVMDKDGRRRIDMTFAARLHAAREEIREQVFRRVVMS